MDDNGHVALATGVVGLRLGLGFGLGLGGWLLKLPPIQRYRVLVVMEPASRHISKLGDEETRKVPDHSLPQY